MTVDEVRVRLRRKLEETFGAEEASVLMDRPPGGWSELVTVTLLDAKLMSVRDTLRAELRDLSASVDRRLKVQTWVTTTALISGMGFAAAIARWG
jgi:hypothetical protein